LLVPRSLRLGDIRGWQATDRARAPRTSRVFDAHTHPFVPRLFLVAARSGVFLLDAKARSFVTPVSIPWASWRVTETSGGPPGLHYEQQRLWLHRFTVHIFHHMQYCYLKNSATSITPQAHSIQPRQSKDEHEGDFTPARLGNPPESLFYFLLVSCTTLPRNGESEIPPGRGDYFDRDPPKPRKIPPTPAPPLNRAFLLRVR
jgi:hypothetical protein